MMEEIRQMIALGMTVTITAKGNSMNPFIVHLRDQLTLGPWKDEDIRKGTVALVKDSNGNYLIHRIIHRDEKTVTLLGDGNIQYTEQAALNDIIGIMHSVTRKRCTLKTSGIIWRIYSWFWMALTPVRRYPLAVWRRLFLRQHP